MENRVLKKDFNTACGELSQNINDCMQKFNLHVYDDVIDCPIELIVLILG